MPCFLSSSVSCVTTGSGKEPNKTNGVCLTYSDSSAATSSFFLPKLSNEAIALRSFFSDSTTDTFSGQRVAIAASTVSSP